MLISLVIDITYLTYIGTKTLCNIIYSGYNYIKPHNNIIIDNNINSEIHKLTKEIDNLKNEIHLLKYN